MHAAAKVIGVCFLLLAGLGGYLLVQASVNYVNITEASTLIEDNLRFEEVRIHLPVGPTDRARVEVVFNLTNAGKIPVAVITLELGLYMDNRSDPRDPVDKMADIYVGAGAVSVSPEVASPVAPGTWSLVTVPVLVQQGTDEYRRFNVTEGGRYFPLIPSPKVVVSFPEFDVTHLFYLPDTYYSPLGVLPVG